MKLQDVKVEALKIMFATYDTNKTGEDINELITDDNLAPLLYAMNGSVNRAIGRIKAKRLQNIGTHTLTDGTDDNYRTTFDLTDIADFYAVEKVIYTDSYGTYVEVSYIIEGDNIIVDDRTSGGSFKLIYYKNIAQLDDTDNDSELDMDNDVAALIPLYIKSELMEEQPQLASEARNLFEQGLDNLHIRNNQKQTKIKAVYKQRRW